MSQQSAAKMVIGRNVHLEVSEIQTVPAKVDSGAFSSSIHARNISTHEKDGVEVLTFNILEDHPNSPGSASLTFNNFEIVPIRNSFGEEEQRYAVDLPVKIHGRVIVSRFTLADRSRNYFPVLLGRRLLSDNFLIDTSAADIEISDLNDPDDRE